MMDSRHLGVVLVLETTLDRGVLLVTPDCQCGSGGTMASLGRVSNRLNNLLNLRFLVFGVRGVRGVVAAFRVGSSNEYAPPTLTSDCELSIMAVLDRRSERPGFPSTTA